MNFINYNPAAELASDDESSSDEMDIEYIAHEYGNIETLIDFGAAADSEATKLEDVVDAIATELKAVTISSDKKTKKYGAD